VPFLRLARDHRGYETTVLLHVPHPGDRPRVLYWYRSAPGVRVGRPALDEDAIRTIEDQHPEIDFDWPHILEVGAASVIEVERRPERSGRARGAEGERARRKGERGRDQSAEVPTAASSEPVEPVEPLPEIEAASEDQPIDNGEDEAAAAQPAHAPDVLAELVGREIATRLRARYAEITARIHQLPADEVTRAAWQARAEPLNPDSWLTPHEILRGVSHADALFDALRRELVG
jgi:hypothetical protein